MSNGATVMRCGRKATQIHHSLPRGRGANALDKVGETYHLIHLCTECHVYVESMRSDAYEAGLLISGYVQWDKTSGKPSYQGPDEYLSWKYGNGPEPGTL